MNKHTLYKNTIYFYNLILNITQNLVVQIKRAWLMDKDTRKFIEHNKLTWLNQKHAYKHKSEILVDFYIGC